LLLSFRSPYLPHTPSHTALDPLSLHDALPISSTGNKDIITFEHMTKMKNKAILGNIGHFDNEIDMAGLESAENVTRINIKPQVEDRKSTRLNSSHVSISYAVVCLKKKLHSRLA